MKCWNCQKEIIKSEHWTPTNKIWYEDYENAPKIHDFKKCYRENLNKESKEEQKDEESLLQFGKTSETKHFSFEVECYYCDFRTVIKNTYERHIITEHYKIQQAIDKFETGTVKYNMCVLAYPNKADFESKHFKEVFPQAKPKGYPWE